MIRTVAHKFADCDSMKKAVKVKIIEHVCVYESVLLAKLAMKLEIFSLDYSIPWHTPTLWLITNHNNYYYYYILIILLTTIIITIICYSNKLSIRNSSYEESLT